MFTLGREAIFRRSNIAKWTALAFQAGAINAIGLLAGHRFVSHITGFASLAAVELADLSFLKAIGMLSVPLYFLLGAMISGYFIDLRVTHQKRAAYTLILWMIFVCLALAWLGSIFGFFGNYGDDFDMDDHYVLLILLALACGLQNAMITSASGSIIRTTHLTGITTDLGIGLARLVFYKKNIRWDAEHRKHEMASLWMRITIIGAFVTGSCVAAFIAKQLGYWSLALPTVTAFILWAWVSLEQKKKAAAAV